VIPAAAASKPGRIVEQEERAACAARQAVGTALPAPQRYPRCGALSLARKSFGLMVEKAGLGQRKLHELFIRP